MNWQPFLKFLNLSLSAKVNKKQFLVPVPWLVCIILTLLSASVFIGYVKLKPEIGTNFFFANDDPQMQEERQIQKLFPQDPQLIISVKGDIKSEKYLQNIKNLSDDLAKLPEVISVQSLSHGPGSYEKAKEGPLWSRVLISDDEKSSLAVVFIEDVDSEKFIPVIQKIVAKHQKNDFEIMVSGEPYIIELIRQSLFKDLKIFSVVAFLIFGSLFLFFFRSWRILAGTLLTCANASMLTLIISQAAGIKTGMLTANLSTIVFVLTLSHLIFIIFNWREAAQKQNTSEKYHPAIEALKMTFTASFWSMLTTFLGFLSLLMVKAEPLRQLGASGSVGTFIAFVTAYALFPLFLSDKTIKPRKPKHEEHEKKIEPFFYRKHRTVFMVLAVITAFIAGGILKVNTDPSLLAYFKEGGDLRNGLEYIDRNGGSSPMSIVVQEPGGNRTFSDANGYDTLWKTTIALENDPEVGSAVSLPIVVAQAEKNVIAKILAVEWLIDLLETQKFGRVAKYFITEDRSKALIMLRMREQGRKDTRLDIMERLRTIVKKKGLEAVLIGGVYSLQGHMSSLVTSSLISGLSFLLILFVIMGWFLSRSIQVTIAMFFSLLMIPSVILGMLGCLNIPLDIISAPAANIAIGMGVDAMIHMLIYIRRQQPRRMSDWAVWKKTSAHFWRPILYTALIIGAGFGIFGLSGFPPTQRFGLMVVTGALMAPCAALIAFVNLATLRRREVKLPVL